jgi:hypothetical protein
LKSTGRITHGLRRAITQQWNECVCCGNRALNGRPVFAGYDADNRPVLVGACCSGQLVELATPIYPTGTLNLSIDDVQPIWRYMDFAKFVAMLQQGGLYFPRADKLEDRFEGAVGLASREADWDRFYLDFFRKAVISPPPGYSPPVLSEEQIEKTAQRLLREMKSDALRIRSLLVSCWHANDVESEALWRLYCPPATLGVAIQSTVGRLWDATNQDTSAVVGRVHYLDFRHSFAGHQKERIFCKRLSLSHEREVRAILDNDHASPVAGRTLVCDLNALIIEVIISPFAPSWFTDVVSEVISKFGYSLHVRQSQLLDEPFY